ncbi:putative oxidoreductase, aryl-alcohol dehydrogenase like protein [Frankia sp. EI5c]|uniref:aldo/keto reductase n=1 Tax=Frankia sp. EI5c TaxID=683316 RepID=UPI0007C3B648|nr:aldo/keto reductase [Frankia sp. EI5c]OAA26166.1 putative oxidoreductase, aryl-alcohol dehydrogenase like protein [Frankia sp. EI5c]
MTGIIARRRLGAHGLEVSALGLGFMSFVRSADDDEQKLATALVNEAIDAGITFFDTADVYGPDVSETLLGRAIAGRRDDLVIATKFGNARDRDTNPNARGVDGRPEYVRAAVEGSLRRLGIDHIDLYYQHRVDPAVPIEETVGALGELVQAGKVRYIGLSEPGPRTLRRAHATHPVTAIQNEWSVFSRDIEAETLPIARELGIGIVPYSPLGRGWLTGRVRSRADLQGRRLAHPRFAEEVFDANRALADEVAAIATEVGALPSQVALAWVLSRGEDVVPIPGTRHAEYLRENVGALGIALAPEQAERLTGIAGRVRGERALRPAAIGVEAPPLTGALS